MGRPPKDPTAQAVAEANAEAVAQPKRSKVLEVTSSFLHSAITWPGVSGSETSISQTKIPGIKQWLLPQGLLLESKGKQCLVPHTNVKNYVLKDLIEV